MLRLSCSTLIAGSLLAALPAAAANAPLLDLSAGNLHFTLNEGTGVSLSVRGVPVIRQSTIYIVKPQWTGAYLDQDNDEATVTSSAEGDVKVGTAVLDNEDAYARYRFELRPDNTFKVSVTFGTKGPASEVEYVAGYLNANLLQGARFSADTIKGKVDGVVPLFATTSDQTASKLTPNVSRIVFDTVQGRIELSVEGSDDLTKSLTLFDSRAGTATWSQKNPIFWLGIGVPSPNLPVGEHTCTITWKFGAPVTKSTLPSVEGTAKVETLKEAQIPFVPDTPVIPQPKEVKAGVAPFRLIPARTHILIPAGANAEEKQAAKELQDEMKEFWGISSDIRTLDAAGYAGTGAIVIATRQDVAAGLAAPGIAAIQKDPAFASLSGHPEGYLLNVTGDTVTIVGADPRGAYYGAQTLKQLIRVDGDGVYVKPVTINDWPSLSMRGVHWFGGPDSFPFHKKMIDRIIAAYKMNTMVYQCDYTQWDSQPKTWNAGYSTPKAEVRKSVDYARAHFIEPIPLLNTLGHSEWLFGNDQNLDICADPKTKFAYDPENPRTYKVVMPLMQEAVDLFKPTYFHIGHDEVTTDGAFPKKGSKKTATELILSDINVMHDWLTAKGIKTMMWGDMLLDKTEATDAGLAPSKEEALKRRAGVPKDIIIADWHYQGSNPEFPSVAVLQKDGFQVLGTTWYDWGNVQNFSRVLNKEKSLGFLQSTWAGYTMFPDIVRGESFSQFVAYLLGAEYAWNGGKPDVASLGYRPDDAFLAVWDRKSLVMTKRAGFSVDLAPAANAGMWEWIPSTDVKTPKVQTAPFPTGRFTMGGITFLPSRPVWLAGSLNPSGAWPESITVPLDSQKAAELHFLWNTTFSAEKGTRVADLSVTYTDGTSVDVPVIYGRQIFAFTDLQAGPLTIPAWQGKTPFGESVSVRDWHWTNPQPGKAIKSVKLSSAGAEAAPVLLGITGIQ